MRHMQLLGLHSIYISVWLLPIEGHEVLYGTGWSLRSPSDQADEGNETRYFVAPVRHQTAAAGGWSGLRDTGFANPRA